VAKVIDNPSPTSDDYWNFWRQNLKPAADNLDIKLTVKKNDTLIQPMTMEIGQPVTIKANGKDYPTHYTGRTLNRDTIVLHFGTVRQSLTAQLNQEG